MWGEVNKVSCSLLVGALWPVVRIRRRLGTKGSQLWLMGLAHWQASWTLSTPGGQNVSLSKETLLHTALEMAWYKVMVGISLIFSRGGAQTTL